MCKAELDANDLLTSSLAVSDAKLVLKFCTQKASVISEVYKIAGFSFWRRANLLKYKLRTLQYAVIAIALTLYYSTPWNKQNLQNVNKAAAEKLGLRLRTFSILISTAILGSRDSISMYDAFLLLGRDTIIARLVLNLKHL
ncbi:MAG: hypothetical protein ACKFI0_00120 [Candidatus Hodgkinia cicadicola]